jgi:hypothetical protein
MWGESLDGFGGDHDAFSSGTTMDGDWNQVDRSGTECCNLEIGGDASDTQHPTVVADRYALCIMCGALDTASLAFHVFQGSIGTRSG